MPFSKRGVATPFRAWTVAHVATMFSIAGLALVGFVIFTELDKIGEAEDDASWAAFELGYEHQRLLLAAEKGESLEEIALRTEIFLSRVMILRDSPLLADVRLRMIGKDLTKLYRSAQTTQELVGELERLEQRDALLWQLRADTRMIRELMLDVASLNRKVNAEHQSERSRYLLFYLLGLEILTMALLGLSVFVFRITRKLRETGRELAQQLATQDAILKSVDAAIVGIGSRGSVLYSNANAQALLGACAASGAQLMRGGDGEHGLAAEIRALLTEDSPGSSGPAVRKIEIGLTNGTRHYEIRASHPLNQHGDEGADAPESTAHIVAITDVTEAEEAAMRRDEYDVRLGEASRLLAYAAISGGIVHEISQPLAAIRNYVHALNVSFTMRHACEEHRAIAEHLSQEVDRAIEVVRNVRRMGPADVQSTGVCDIQEAIAHSVRLATLGCHPAPPIVICDGEGKAFIAGSLPMVGQVIVNLLRNALSASAAAGRPGAEVAVRLIGGQAEIMVADHGEGVSEEAAKSMFQPFSKSVRGGMGLGLAICQRIATSLGGSLTWENGMGGVGAIFKFTVPLASTGSAT